MTKHEANKTKAVNSGPVAGAGTGAGTGASQRGRGRRRDLKNAAETKTLAKSFGPPLAAGSRRARSGLTKLTKVD